MITSNEVDAIIFRAIGNLNADLPAADQIPAAVTTPLFGPESAVDSLGFVSLIVDVETALNVDHGLNVSLAGDFGPAAQSPFSTVGSLRDYILKLAAEQ